VANSALCLRRMLRKRVGFQGRLTFKFFLAKIAENTTLAARVGRDTFVAYRLRTRRVNNSWTGASVRSEDDVGNGLRLMIARLNVLVRLLEMVIPLDEGGGQVIALRA